MTTGPVLEYPIEVPRMSYDIHDWLRRLGDIFGENVLPANQNERFTRSITTDEGTNLEITVGHADTGDTGVLGSPYIRVESRGRACMIDDIGLATEGEINFRWIWEALHGKTTAQSAPTPIIEGKRESIPPTGTTMEEWLDLLGQVMNPEDIKSGESVSISAVDESKGTAITLTINTRTVNVNAIKAKVIKGRTAVSLYNQFGRWPELSSGIPRGTNPDLVYIEGRIEGVSDFCITQDRLDNLAENHRIAQRSGRSFADTEVDQVWKVLHARRNSVAKSAPQEEEPPQRSQETTSPMSRNMGDWTALLERAMGGSIMKTGNNPITTTTTTTVDGLRVEYVSRVGKWETFPSKIDGQKMMVSVRYGIMRSPVIINDTPWNTPGGINGGTADYISASVGGAQFDVSQRFLDQYTARTKPEQNDDNEALEKLWIALHERANRTTGQRIRDTIDATKRRIGKFIQFWTGFGY